jgi:hypothetical protein
MDEQNTSSEVREDSLTKWKNPPTLADMKQNWTDAKPFHDDQCKKIDRYLDNLNGTGSAAVKAPKGNSQIVPKLIRKQAEWRYAALSEPFLSTEDLFNAKPTTWEDRKAAQQNEILLNYQFTSQIDRTKLIDEYVRTAVDEGTVIVQTGWEFEEEEYEEEVATYQFVQDPEFVETLNQLQQLQAQSPSEFMEVEDGLKQALEISLEQGAPFRPEQIGTEVVKKTRTLYNRPTVAIRSTKNITFDPLCEGDISKAKFAVYTYESSLADLKKDKRYKNLDKINASGNDILGVPDHELGRDAGSFNFKDKPRQKFVVHEYWGFWDIHGDGKLQPVVASWVGNTLIRMEENPFPDKALPFVVVQYLPVRKALHGEPDGALLEDNQKILGAVMRGSVDLMAKSANGQTGVRKDMLDATNKRKYQQGLDYEFNQNVDPRQGVFMHTYPEIPQSAQFMIQLQNYEAESLTGVKAFSQGISSSSLGDVAAGIRGALDASSKRELGILRRLSNGMVQIARKITAMNAEFLSDQEVVRLTNETFVEVKRDDLAGNFDLKLSISTAEEDNNKAEQLAFMLQTVGPQEDPAVRRMILGDICRLRKMPDLAKKLEEYEPQPDPIQQEIQKLTVEKLRAEVAKLQAEAQLGNARAGTEAVKQNHIQSDKDLKDLDFVEQESGVKQARDLEKQGAQARAQAETKVIDHQLNMQTEHLKGRFALAKEGMKKKVA